METNLILPKLEHAILSIGQFASTDNGLGIGKVTNLADTEAELEYFESISVQRKLILPRSKLIAKRIAPQTRCYVKVGETWHIGRARKTVGDSVEVDFPEGRSEFLPLQNVYVRCALPIANPTDVLAHWGHETVYFYERRRKFLEGLLIQRQISQGMDGLLSSSIKLLPHQVKAAKRVLADPVPRYLLADEVGLGKTIEAGIIIRQVLIDQPDARVLVLTPSSLQGQWQNELLTKFHIDHWFEQISFCTMEDVSLLASKEVYELMVVDEAHHLAKWHFSGTAEQKASFLKCQALAHRATGLLLLSATPALHNEEAFLCMLNMLDPLHFSMDKLEEFTNLLHKRDDIGKVLFLLQEDSEDIIILAALGNLKTLFWHDSDIKPLLEALANYFAEGKDQLEERNQLIRNIRLMVSEGYRIHRRIIRNRRADVWKVQRKKPFTEFEEDYREVSIIHVLHNWRLDALLHSKDAAERRAHYQQVYFMLLAALGANLDFLKILVEHRLTHEHTVVVAAELEDTTDVAALEASLFPGERELLLQINEIIEEAEDDQFTRAALLEGRLSMLQDREVTPKVVVFTSYTFVSDQLYPLLSASEAFGTNSVCYIHKHMDETAIVSAVKTFKESETHWILLCDRIGEEGLNLQFATTIIHYDLPWSPNRVEQRIGRLDRIGQENEIESFTFLGSLEDESLAPVLPYYTLLTDGLKIFENSINNLQFILETTLPQFRTWLFEEGGNLSSASIAEKIIAIQEELAKEVKRIHNQDMLDAFASDDNGDTDFLAKLTAFEEQPQQIRACFEPWIREALNFTTHNYERVIRYTWSEFTLVPIDLLVNHFGSSTSLTGAYDRRVAVEQASPLYRMGHSLIDMLLEYFQWDDRGKVYAILRHCPSISREWQGFKFDFLIEADNSLYTYQSDIINKTIGRRADALLSPFLCSVFVTLEGNIVTDPEILSYLNKKIYKYDKRDALLGYDYNLTKRRLPFLQNNYSNSQWEDLCQNAYQKAFSHVVASEEYQEKVREGVQKAKRHSILREAQLKVHQRHGFNQSTTLLEHEQATGWLLHQSIETPAIKVDSVGFYWLSAEKPETT